MAHAGMDHHMDFISLLSLSHLGIPEPESLALSANNKDQTETAVVSQALSESDYTNTAEQHHQQSAPAQPTPASRCLQQNGLGIQILNGTSQSLQGGIIQSTFNGVKRLREQLEYNGIEGAGGGAECCAETTLDLCEDLMIPSKRLCSESSYLNARTLVHQALPPPPPPPPPPPHHHHSPLPSLPDENNVEMNDQTIPITNGVSHSATTAESPLLTTNMDEVSNCSGCGGRRRVQICTGFIEEVMFTSKVSNGESCLPQQSSLMQCPRCLSGEPGHLDHMMQNSSTMDTS